MPLKATKSANVHLIIPASNPDPNLCKTLLTAGILNYPTPVIVNWNETFDNDKFLAGGSHLAKITGISRYLVGLSSAQDDDLVLTVDGYDIWFQLRPQTFLDRYFAINAKANKRIADELGDVASKYEIRQEIVFSSQKRCWPWTENDPPCYAVPESSLPRDIFGPHTDTDVGFEENPYLKFRPRYLNSGVIIGTVGAMRKMFMQAEKLLRDDEREANLGSDQYVFGHILGDQSIWREAMRRDSLSEAQREAERLIDTDPKSRVNFPEKHIQEVRAKAAKQEDGRFEFGIGMDYESILGLPTVFSEHDTAWLKFHNKDQMRAAEQQLGITPEQSHLGELASDISGTDPPFSTLQGESAPPQQLLWDDVDLFTNVWTGNVPAIIHHNAHRDNRKALRVTWWDKFWAQKYARALFDAWIQQPIVPIAKSGPDKDSQKEWLPAEREKGGGRTPWMLRDEEWTREWIAFEDICKDYHEEVFRDGKGPWKVPAAP